ncbi:MAG: response regulator transcription factor [Candidatus Aminicenantes bacterium]|nr:response regulator transcription factor [Candidatus Aminicenantes bacterium]
MFLRLVVNYGLSIGLGIYAISICYQLYKNYQFRFLLIYLYYLIAVSIYGFFAWTGEFISGCLFEASQIPEAVALKPLVCLIAYPFIPLSVYLFIRLIREFLNKNVPVLIGSLYWLVWILVSVGIFLGTHEFIEHQQQYIFSAMHRTSGILMLIFRYLALNHLFFHLSSIEDKKKARIAKYFGIYYVITFSLYFIATHFAANVFAFNFAWPLVYFSLNLPILFYLKKFLYLHCIDQYVAVRGETDLKQLFVRYRISDLEQDIIQLLVNGKTNREIGDLLFISTGTIKNYTSSIYKKMQVKNRYQLINMIRNIHMMQ